MSKTGTLIFFCGKMAAGKSTKAVEYASSNHAVLISEDEWLKALYPEQIKSVQDYLKYSRLLKPVLLTHVAQMLLVGTSVVMDFPANTRDQRLWFREVAETAAAPHRMIYLNLSDEQCLEQLRHRRMVDPSRAAFDTEENFKLITRFFEAPDRHEGLEIEIVGAAE